MRYIQAQRIAEDLLERMQPFCNRIEIAGGIRQHQQEIDNIEIVCIPRWEQRTVTEGLFQEEKQQRVNLLHEWALSGKHPLRWLKPDAPNAVPWQPRATGKKWRGVDRSQLTVDIFLCSRENWGLTLLLATGSAAFSEAVLAHAASINRPCMDGHLHINGLRMPTEDEKDVFKLLGLHYTPPEQRIDANLQKLPCPPDVER